MLSRAWLMAALVLIAGCVSEPPPLPSNHPANPDAVESPSLPISDTLKPEEQDQSATQPNRTTTHQHAVHEEAPQ